MINAVEVYNAVLERYNLMRNEEGQPAVSELSRQIVILACVLTEQINHQLNLKQDK